MHNFIKKLEKKWGEHKVFWGGVGVFVILLLILCFSFLNHLTTFGGRMLGNFSYSLARPMNRMMSPETTMPSSGMFGDSIIRLGSLSIVSSTADAAVRTINDVAARYGGYIEKSYVYDVGPNNRAAQMTIRIPNGYFDAAIRDIKNSAVQIISENTDVESRPDSSADFDARITALQNGIKQYKLLLAKATKIDDILKLRSAIDTAQGNVSVLQNDSAYLSHEGALSRISVSVTSQKTLTSPEKWSPWSATKEGFTSLTSDLLDFVQFLILFILALPVFIFKLSLFALALIAIWRGILWVEKELKSNGHKR